MVELEVGRDEALTILQALEAELAAKGAAIASRDRQLEKVQKRVVQLEGMSESRMVTVDHRLALGSRPALPSAPDKKIVLDRQFADLRLCPW